MAEYVINIDDDLPFNPQFLQVIGAEPNGQVRITYIEFDTLEPLTDEYIDEHSRDLQDDAYERGYNVGFKEGTDAKQRRRRDADEKLIEQGKNEAWEAAKKILNNGSVIFGGKYPTSYNIIHSMTASEAIAKLQAYEEKKKADDEIKVGDEVESLHTGRTFIIHEIDGEDVKGYNFKSRGTCYGGKNDFKKTGRHFHEVVDLLEALKGGDA